MSTADPARPRFLLVACAPGVEPWLKAEIAREHPDLRPSFSRPGLVSFKQGEAPVAPAALRSVFARAVASSHGPLEGDAAAAVRSIAAGRPVRVFVHAGAARSSAGRAPGPPGDRALWPEQVRAEVERSLATQLAPDGIEVGGRAREGEQIIDVFTAPEDGIWLGDHVHATPMQPWPAGVTPITLPADAPSRAYLKIEEAIAWAELPVRAGELAVEIGSAPGGASLALLRRGVAVIGVDPGAMDPIVTGFDGSTGPRFRHLQVPVGALAKADLPRDVDWLALDVNLAPPVALRYAERIVGPRRDRLRGAVLTLKMNDEKVAADVPALLERIRAMGLSSVRATQLPTNRREICVVALNPASRAFASPGPSGAAPRGRASRRGSRAPTSR